MKKIGFIGMGNMAQALAAGFIRAGKLEGAEIMAYAPNQEKLKKNSELIGFIPASSVQEAAFADVDARVVDPQSHPEQGGAETQKKRKNREPVFSDLFHGSLTL